MPRPWKSTRNCALIHPLHLELETAKAFQQEAKGIAVKSINQANINTTVTHDIKMPVLSLGEQKRFVARVETLECAIADAPAKKLAVMQLYL